MRTFLTLENRHEDTLPEGTPWADIRFPARLVEVFLEEYTQPGDTIFDPFAGFGTTLIVAERMGRVPVGIEYNHDRWEYARTQLRPAANLLHGDSRRLIHDLPAPIDFSFTSPPYMNRGDAENPLTDCSELYAPGTDGYEIYLRELSALYRALGERMRPGAWTVIEASNLRREDHLTTLAWDIARAVGEVLPLERETIVGWEPTYGYGYDHSYCLVFRVPDRT
jgi:hypothetical protein